MASSWLLGFAGGCKLQSACKLHTTQEEIAYFVVRTLHIMLLLSLLLYIIIIIIVLRARGVAFVNTKPFLHLVLSYGEIARKWQYRMSIKLFHLS